jgi:peptidoglycan-N-acetylglucosamine deacetylase
MPRSTASLSLDLDNKWSYLKTHGDPNWAAASSYLDEVTSRFGRLLTPRQIRMTVFVVGRDAADAANGPALRRLVDAGHEIGNHSFHHEPWLHLYTDEQLREEFDRAEQAIVEATGQRPTGFRGPGFSFSAAVLELLAARGYEFDCSTFPTFLGPLARAWYFLRSGLNRKERAQRKALFGSFWDGFRRLKPYRWRTTGRELIEIPVTTMPIFRAPIHASYVLYLARWSEALALAWFRTGLFLCWLTGVQPSVLLHPLDVLGCDDESDLGFFPAMDLPADRKIRVMSRMLDALVSRFEVVPMGEHARRLRSARLPLKPLPPAVSASALPPVATSARPA